MMRSGMVQRELLVSVIFSLSSTLSSARPLVLAGALLEQSEALLDRGIHPIRIADGFDRACVVAVEQLNRICETIEFSHENTQNLLKTAKTSLGSKMYV